MKEIFCWVNYKSSYYPEPDDRIRDKVKVVLDLLNLLQKNNSMMQQVLYNEVAKRDFIALKVDIGKLGINKLLNVPCGLNNLRTKLDDLDVGNFKTVPVDVKKLSNVVSNEVVENPQFSKLNTKENSLENKIPDGTTLIDINQYST